MASNELIQRQLVGQRALVVISGNFGFVAFHDRYPVAFGCPGSKIHQLAALRAKRTEAVLRAPFDIGAATRAGHHLQRHRSEVAERQFKFDIVFRCLRPLHAFLGGEADV